MTPRDLLGVLVRLAGLGFLQCGFFDLYYVVIKTFGFQTQSQLPLWLDVRGFAIYSAWGLLLIVAAKPIVQLTYLFEKRQ
jgi:hypothetical protein